MPKSSAFIFLVLGLGVWFGQSWAADSQGNYRANDYGTKACGAYLQARRENATGLESLAYLHWLTGYLTAFNAMIPDTYAIQGGIDNEGLMGWLDNYCPSHPTEPFAGAVFDLVQYLYPNRLPTPPNP